MSWKEKESLERIEKEHWERMPKETSKWSGMKKKDEIRIKEVVGWRETEICAEMRNMMEWKRHTEKECKRNNKI